MDIRTDKDIFCPSCNRKRRVYITDTISGEPVGYTYCCTHCQIVLGPVINMTPTEDKRKV